MCEESSSVLYKNQETYRYFQALLKPITGKIVDLCTYGAPHFTNHGLPRKNTANTVNLPIY